jgi:predicted RNA-binding Zn-ribbon protein involved in translation (DUF1610 family)
MAEPRITVVQEHIIEVDGARYRLVDLNASGLERSKYQPRCQCCDGKAFAPRKDEDGLPLFDHYCYGHHIPLMPLMCDPDRAIVYKHVDDQLGRQSEEQTTVAEPIKYVCPACGSENVLRDAYAAWDIQKQEWVLHDTYNNRDVCNNCGETNIELKVVRVEAAESA